VSEVTKTIFTFNDSGLPRFIELWRC